MGGGEETETEFRKSRVVRGGSSASYLSLSRVLCLKHANCDEYNEFYQSKNPLAPRNNFISLLLLPFDSISSSTPQEATRIIQSLRSQDLRSLMESIRLCRTRSSIWRTRVHLSDSSVLILRDGCREATYRLR